MIRATVPPPHFPFNPNAYKLGIIEQQDIVCECCQQPRAYNYTGPIFCVADVEELCPWCIADGSAARKWDAEFQDLASVEGHDPNPQGAAPAALNPASVEEVLFHSPAYNSWQQGVWLTHCQDMCVFVGYVGGNDIRPLLDELRPDLEAWPNEEFLLRNLSADGSLTGYLFQCRHCNLHRLHIDCD
ncbi:CbrC family protein [Hymenobacter endophyticus]|uniref:CbrC family protein n=1 Tax=Hymenobacter endophyticus TaxID=3076335 RepID=A0ABU3TN54_9BACT|nr:CbrC family protein [Hymenobacter endophyticus]MDU0372823.1 CbrC family protein [Hymenobacter endophyticus]